MEREKSERVATKLTEGQCESLHTAVVKRMNARAAAIEGDQLPPELRSRIQNRLDALKRLETEARSEGTGIEYELTEAHRRLLRDELLDIYTSLRPKDAEKAVESDVEVLIVCVAKEARGQAADNERLRRS